MSYRELERRIEKISGNSFLGYVHAPDRFYPFYWIKKGRGLKKVLLLGAVHGDEPAGAHAILHFFERETGVYEADFEFTAFPCVNPWGFEHFERGNANRLNLNREFKRGTASKELQILLWQLKSEQYVAAIDFHETMRIWTPVGNQEPGGECPEEFYVYETCADKSLRVGREIVGNVESAGIPVCKLPKIGEDRNNNGVIWYPEDCGTGCYAQGVTSEEYFARYHTNHTFTVETSRDNQPLEKRVLADIITLKTILESKR